MRRISGPLLEPGSPPVLPTRSKKQVGIDAFASKSSAGRPRTASIKRVRDLLLLVLEYPFKAGEVHWTGIKLHGWLKQEIQDELGYRTVIRYLHEIDYNLRVPRS